MFNNNPAFVLADEDRVGLIWLLSSIEICLEGFISPTANDSFIKLSHMVAAIVFFISSFISSVSVASQAVAEYKINDTNAEMFSLLKFSQLIVFIELITLFLLILKI